MPLVPKGTMFSDLPGAAGDADQLMQAVGGATHGGAVPMQPGGHLQLQYPGLRAQSGVDWQKVSPRLLTALDKEAQKRKTVIVIQSGYRDHQYNDRIGGHPQSTHKRGLAVDAFINGHPIGEVISADELSKLGISVGGPQGDDPAHVDLRGIPVKMPPKPATEQGGAGGTASNSQPAQGLSGAGGMDLPPGGVLPGSVGPGQ